MVTGRYRNTTPLSSQWRFTSVSAVCRLLAPSSEPEAGDDSEPPGLVRDLFPPGFGLARWLAPESLALCERTPLTLLRWLGADRDHPSRFRANSTIVAAFWDGYGGTVGPARSTGRIPGLSYRSMIFLESVSPAWSAIRSWPRPDVFPDLIFPVKPTWMVVSDTDMMGAYVGFDLMDRGEVGMLEEPLGEAVSEDDEILWESW